MRFETYPTPESKPQRLSLLVSKPLELLGTKEYSNSWLRQKGGKRGIEKKKRK